MRTGYFCEQCPLGFEVGFTVYGDLSGGRTGYVCRHCGTMHRIEHRADRSDILSALPGPLRAIESGVIDPDGDSPLVWSGLPFTEDSWSEVGPLPRPDWFRRRGSTLYDRARRVPLGRLACSHCRGLGGLVSREWPTAADGSWPRFGEHCPVCAGELRVLYVCTS